MRFCPALFAFGFLVILNSCVKTVPYSEYHKKYMYFCEFDINRGYYVMSNSCDSIIELRDADSTVHSFHITDCKTGIVEYEKRNGPTLLVKGSFSAGRKKTDKSHWENRENPGEYVKYKIRVHTTKKSGTWYFYDATGFQIKTEVYK